MSSQSRDGELAEVTIAGLIQQPALRGPIDRASGDDVLCAADEPQAALPADLAFRRA